MEASLLIFCFCMIHINEKSNSLAGVAMILVQQMASITIEKKKDQCRQLHFCSNAEKSNGLFILKI